MKLYRDYVGPEIYRSDYQTASAMRADLDRFHAQRDQALALASELGALLATASKCSPDLPHGPITAALAKLATLNPPL